MTDRLDAPALDRWHTHQVVPMPYRLLQNAAFDLDVIRLLGLAYEDACARMPGGDTGHRETIARRIIDAATVGERDVHKLAEYGLNGLA